MKSMRIALLAAAALAVVPAAASTDTRDPADRDRGGHVDHGNRVGGDHARPAPPEAPPRGSGMMVMPRGAPDGGRPPMPQPPQAQPQDRGGWQGGWRGGQGGPGRGDARIDRPIPVPNADTGQARAQWRQGDRGGVSQYSTRPNDDHRWDNARGQWNGGDRRPGNEDGRSGDHRWDNSRGQWNGGDRRSGNDDDHNRDHRWDGDRDRRDHNGDRRWDGRSNSGGGWNGGRTWGGHGDHRWDASRWRNDHRYDWRDWRSSHHDLFRRHYYAPRGYHYRSVYAGFFLEPFFYGSNYWLDDPFDYRLPPVEWPLRWVHYYNDALLVDVTTGEVIDVIPNFFF